MEEMDEGEVDMGPFVIIGGGSRSLSIIGSEPTRAPHETTDIPTDMMPPPCFCPPLPSALCNIPGSGSCSGCRPYKESHICVSCSPGMGLVGIRVVNCVSTDERRGGEAS